METALKTWRRRCGAGWLVGADAGAACDAFATFHEYRVRHPGPMRVQLCDTDPARYLAGFFAGMLDEDPVDVFLAPARATAAELAAIEAGIEPDFFWARGELVSCGMMRGGRDRVPVSRVMIPTGGTTAGPRFAVHTWRTLEQAALGLQAWLGGGPIDSLCTLPLHHVSGLMQAVRAYLSGGMLTLTDWPHLAAGHLPVHGARPGMVSLVPTQLARVLELAGGADWLRGFRCIFLGGAPAWPALISRARAERLPLAPCYGMTETAAQIATMRPEEFLAGGEGVGCALPHVSLEIVDPGNPTAPPRGDEGRICVRGTSLFCGYFPEAGWEPLEQFITGDRGVLDPDGHLTVLGRVDAIINTGGEKVDPQEVESAIRALGTVDVAVLGVPDPAWGEMVVAVVSGSTPSDADLRLGLKSTLAAHKVPKRFVRVDALPRSEVGKLDRRALRELCRGISSDG